MKEEELSSILERLKKQAKLVNSKNLTNDWDEQLLQKELEGECHMLKVLHARNANFFGKFFQERFFSISYSIPFFTYLDTCKARTANRKIMSKKKKRLDTIVDILGKKGIQVSQQNLDTGIFPWHDTKQCLILYDVHFFESINYYNCSL